MDKTIYNIYLDTYIPVQQNLTLDAPMHQVVEVGGESSFPLLMLFSWAYPRKTYEEEKR